MSNRATHRDVAVDGASMRLVECGPEDGPVVVLCHGFPETWYSWRHQLWPLAEAGYRAVALDLRGFGRSHSPAAVEAYTTLAHVGDVVGVLDALDAPTAVIVGHDHGSAVAWLAATVRPDRFRAVVSLSVPLAPRSPVDPEELQRELLGDEWFYAHWFREPGVAEAVLDPDPGRFLLGFFYTLSGDCPGGPLRGLVGGTGGDIFSRLTVPDELPAWLTSKDLVHYAGEFARTGFRGGLNLYRCGHLNWMLERAFADVRVSQPALFVAGDRDCLMTFFPDGIEQMATTVPGLVDAVVLPGCGHWTQQERPAEVNDALLAFLDGLDR